MPHESPSMTAAVRAIGGESDLAVVMPALADERLARVIACAPDADPVALAVAALCGGLPSLLDAPTRADPALHAALARLIGTPAGWNALRTWAEAAPAGWGRPHAAALIDAVRQGVCHPGAAAALIGPDDRVVSLFRSTQDIAFAIRRWGQADPAAPTAWAKALAPAERDRLITAVRRAPFAVASCLPWLPPDMAGQTPIDDDALGAALDAFAVASPTARAQHAAVLQRLVDRAHPMHLAALTRLACVMQTDEIWSRVQTLIRESPDDAQRVVAEAPWDDLPQDVRAAILDLADGSDVCAAVAAARGERASAPISWTTAGAFFAVIVPTIWNAREPAAQRPWLLYQVGGESHLAVRSLGPRPEFLARATLDDALVRAALRHARDAPTLRAALLPVALRGLPPAAAHALIAAMPPPPDPGAFFCIASGRDDAGAIARVQNALRSPADLAFAVTIQRCARGHDRALPVCTALTDALHGRTWDDLAPFMPLLDDDARAALTPDADALVGSLAHPDRRDALRRTLDRLAALPPEVAVPTFVALKRLTPRIEPDAATAVADALRAHGDVFLEIADALTDDLRAAVLPLPEDARQADALRALARDDPPTAQRLALALRNRDWKGVIRLAPSLPQWARNAIPPHADDLVARLARPDGRDKMRAALQQLASAAPDADVPARCALDRLATKNADAPDAAAVLAHAMRDVGDTFVSIMDALADDGLRQALLPLPEDAAAATALRGLAQVDPLSARYLANAILEQNHRVALLALLEAPPCPAAAVWQALDDAMRRAIGVEVAAASPDADLPAVRDPLAAFALAAAHSGDADLRATGVAALTARPEVTRTIWEHLPSAVQRSLGALPAFADLPPQPATPAIRRTRRRGGMIP